MNGSVLTGAALFLAAVLAGSEATPADELVLGTVRIGLGAFEDVVVAELKKEFRVEPRGAGGWEVITRASGDESMPLVGISTEKERIRGISFKWGPGVTPGAEEMAKQLAHALPEDDECRIENVTGPFEGGTVRTMIFHCSGTIIRMTTGVWPQGNTASISLRFE